MDIITGHIMGDFVEFFDEDAERAAKHAELTVITRHGRTMAGYPKIRHEHYTAKFNAAGILVALK